MRVRFSLEAQNKKGESIKIRQYTRQGAFIFSVGHLNFAFRASPSQHNMVFLFLWFIKKCIRSKYLERQSSTFRQAFSCLINHIIAHKINLVKCPYFRALLTYFSAYGRILEHYLLNL